MKGRRGTFGAWVLYGITLMIFAIGVWRSGVWAEDRRHAMAYVAQFSGGDSSPHQKLCESAEKYWHAYPDVAENDFFGRRGNAGCLGAFEHWTRHGRQEGRIWHGPLK